MSSPVRALVKVQVGGEELQLRTELPPEYARDVAAHFDEALRRIRTASPALEAYKAAILAGLAVTDELFRARTADGELAERMAMKANEIGRLLPPTKRGTRNSSRD